MKGSGAKAKDITKEIAWVNQLREWQEHAGTGNADALLESMKWISSATASSPSRRTATS